MSERISLTPDQMDLLRRIEGGQNQAHEVQVLKLASLGLIVAMRLGRGTLMGVSITHKGRRVALGMAADQGDGV